jgi:ribose transport system ATP-binding protein
MEILSKGSSFHKGETMEGETVLQVRNLTKTFGATRALSGVSLKLFAGEIHCVLGENGAGKSTLGKIIGGLFSADEGDILMGAHAVHFSNPREARARGVAMVYQELSLAGHLSVRANLWLGSERQRFPLALTSARRERGRVQNVLGLLGLEGLDSERPVRDLPIATQQLVEIGKSLMFDPKVVIFDEPTAMLGAVEKRRFFEVIRTLRASRIAAVLVTHHIEDVMEVGDRVTIMRNGSVIDSFPMTDEVDAEKVVERLTGKRQKMATTLDKPRIALRPLVEIESIPTAGGSRALSIGLGEIVGFYGVAGCGSDALVRGLVGLDDRARSPSTTYRLNGAAFRPRSPAQALAQGVAYLPAGRASNCLMPTRSIKDNLLLTQFQSLSRFGFINPVRERDVCKKLLAECGVKFGHAEDRITSLSGGNQQKVLLARAMTSAKKLIVLEEPSAGVDIEAKAQIHERIRAIARSGVAVIMISSDLPEILGVCDTVVTMFAGDLVSLYLQPTAADQPAIIADVLGQRGDTTQMSIAESAA